MFHPAAKPMVKGQFGERNDKDVLLFSVDSEDETGGMGFVVNTDVDIEDNRSAVSTCEYKQRGYSFRMGLKPQRSTKQLVVGKGTMQRSFRRRAGKSMVSLVSYFKSNDASKLHSTERKLQMSNDGSDTGSSSLKTEVMQSPSILSRVHNQQFIKSLFSHKCLKITQVLCALYIAFCTFSYTSISPRDPTTGWILDVNSSDRTSRGVILINGHERAIVATSIFQMICLGITRCSAFFMYPGKQSHVM